MHPLETHQISRLRYEALRAEATEPVAWVRPSRSGRQVVGAWLVRAGRRLEREAAFDPARAVAAEPPC